MTSSRELLESASRKARDRGTALPFDSNPDSPESAENGLIQARLLATRHDLDGARALLLVAMPYVFVARQYHQMKLDRALIAAISRRPFEFAHSSCPRFRTRQSGSYLQGGRSLTLTRLEGVTNLTRRPYRCASLTTARFHLQSGRRPISVLPIHPITFSPRRECGTYSCICVMM